MSMYKQEFGKVAVLMGGPSAEREISLKSGASVLTALQESNVNAEAIDVSRETPGEVFEKLLKGGFERVFIALHGPLGEDGCIQGGLEVLGMPYSGSGVMASSICMSKLMTKKIWQGCEIPTPKYRVLNNQISEDELIAELGLPMIFKPISQGSSIGMTKVSSKAEIEAALLNGEALPIIRLETPRSFYDFDAKYQSDETQYHCPCGLSESVEKNIQDLAVHAFNVTEASGWGRVDVMLDQNDQPWFLEINTVPGMTDHSLVPMAARANNIGFNELVIKILQTSFKEDSKTLLNDSVKQSSVECNVA